MATIRAYTTIEQSRKLAEILPLESADMYYDYNVQKHEYYIMVMDEQFDDICVRAWSLATLLSVLPKKFIYNFHTYQFMYNTHAMFYINVDTYDEDTFCSTNENLIDACYELIIRLHELNLL